MLDGRGPFLVKFKILRPFTTKSVNFLNIFLDLTLKGVSHEIFRVLFWHIWIDLGLYKNLWLFLIFSVQPLILYLCLKFRCG